MNKFEYKVKRENPNDEFVLITDWAIESGDKIAEGDYLCCLESSKNSYDLEADRDGYIHYQANEGDKLDVGDLLFVITDKPEYDWNQTDTSSNSSEIKVTRKAAKLIKNYEINEQDLTPQDGKVTELIVREYIETNNLSLKTENIDSNHASPPNTEKVVDETIPYTESEPDSTKSYEIHFMTKNRDLIYSKVTKEIPFEILEGHLAKHRGLTIGELIAFCTSKAVEKFPLVNAYFHNGNIRTYQEFNLGLAMNLGRGLKVPVLRSFSKLDISAVSNSTKELAMSYLRDELKAKDLSGGTFTITDLSSLGVKDFMPVVNMQQSSILGICSKSSATNSLNIVLGFDHRVIDGMYAAQFLNHIEKNIKDLDQS